MTNDIDALVADPGFRWMRRMACSYLDVDGQRVGYSCTVLSVRGDGSLVVAVVNSPVVIGRDADPRPDLDDPATQGCMLALVRGLYGHGPDRDVNIERTEDGYALAVRVRKCGVWVYDDLHGDWLAGQRLRPAGTRAWCDRDTYGETLVAAILAAPKKGAGGQGAADATG